MTFPLFAFHKKKWPYERKTFNSLLPEIAKEKAEKKKVSLGGDM